MSPLVTVLVGTSLLGCVAGVVGSFAVLRRRALVGDLIAHAALPGIVIAFVILGERRFSALLLGALISGVAGVALVTFIVRWTRTKEDAALGIVLSTFFGGGVAMMPLVLKMESGNKAGLETYLYGQAASMVRQDLLLIAGVAAIALLVVALVYKEFKLLSFDPGFARAQGWPTLLLDLGMMALIALVTVVGLPAVGVVLMAAMLITPAATARLWTNRLGVMLITAGLLGAATGALGTLLSDDRWRTWLPFDPLKFGTNNKGLPTGPLIVLSGAMLFLISLAIAPRRGLLARAITRLRLRLQVGQDHLLRALYEESEPVLPKPLDIPVHELSHAHGWSPIEAWLQLAWASRRGLIDRTRYSVRLTSDGITEAARLTKRHRLWELFLIHGANIAPDHVDRDADDIEHVLPPEIVDRLEAEWLREQPDRTLPLIVPDSPHVLSPASAAAVKEGHHG